jgi:hypothetical protein
LSKGNPFAESILDRGEFSKLPPGIRINTECRGVPKLELVQYKVPFCVTSLDYQISYLVKIAVVAALERLAHIIVD